MTLRWIALALTALALTAGCGRKGEPATPGQLDKPESEVEQPMG